MADPRPSGLLVLYEEAKGVRTPQVKLFGPSPRIERQVNEWIQGEADLRVHRIEWIPSGGLLGASVLYSRGGGATDALRLVVPGLESVEKRLKQRGPLESFAQFSLFTGVILAIVGMFLFNLFYPETWYGEAGALVDPASAVEWTVLSLGLGVLLIFASIAALFRARVT